MTKLKNIHPGEILQEEFLLPMQISAYRLAKETFLPQTPKKNYCRHRLALC
jgi:plasmid maintenance system antidote protein VapI